MSIENNSTESSSTETVSETTRLLAEWRRGDEKALDALMPRVYDELRRMAAGYLRHEKVDHTLQTSALVNEAYLRLIDQNRVHWQGRAHFMAIAARMMRRVLVDHARERGYAKRGGGAVKVPLQEAVALPSDERSPDLLALEDALIELESLDPHQVRVVELRYFAGLKVDEIAEATDLSVSTVTRKWSLAKAWLYRRLARE